MDGLVDLQRYSDDDIDVEEEYSDEDVEVLSSLEDLLDKGDDRRWMREAILDIDNLPRLAKAFEAYPGRNMTHARKTKIADLLEDTDYLEEWNEDIGDEDDMKEAYFRVVGLLWKIVNELKKRQGNVSGGDGDSNMTVWDERALELFGQVNQKSRPAPAKVVGNCKKKQPRSRDCRSPVHDEDDDGPRPSSSRARPTPHLLTDDSPPRASPRVLTNISEDVEDEADQEDHPRSRRPERRPSERRSEDFVKRRAQRDLAGFEMLQSSLRALNHHAHHEIFFQYPQMAKAFDDYERSLTSSTNELYAASISSTIADRTQDEEEQLDMVLRVVHYIKSYKPSSALSDGSLLHSIGDE